MAQLFLTRPPVMPHAVDVTEPPAPPRPSLLTFLAEIPKACVLLSLFLLYTLSRSWRRRDA